MPRDAARCREMQREAARCLFLQQDASLCGCLCCLLTGWLGEVRSQLQLLTATPNACAGGRECVLRAHCGYVRIVRIVAGLLLLMVGSVLCV